MVVNTCSKIYEQIPRSSDNKPWWHYVDDSVTPVLLDGKCLFYNGVTCTIYMRISFYLELAHEFVEIYESCPSRFRAKIDSKQQVKLMCSW